MRRRKRVFHYIPRAMLLSSASLAIRIRRIPVSWVTPNFLSSKNYEVDAQGCLGSDCGAAGRNGCGVCAAAWYVVLSTGLHAQQATRAERIFCLRDDTKSALPTPIPPPAAHRPPTSSTTASEGHGGTLSMLRGRVALPGRILSTGLIRMCACTTFEGRRKGTRQIGCTAENTHLNS